MARTLLADWGIGHRLYDPMDTAALAATISERTKLVWLEAPGSVTMEFPDLPALLQVARRHGLVVALDNTWGAGLAFCGFDLEGQGEGEGSGVDIVMQALTKYPSGGGDVLMGSVTTRDEALHLQLKRMHMRIGFGIGANDAETVLRSLPSLPLRYAAQDQAARALAQWFAKRPGVARVLHPALPGSPGPAHWAETCSAAAGLFTVELDARWTPAQADAVVDALELFRIGWSWGGPVSLAVPYDAASLRSRPVPYRGTLIRFSLGLEAVADLQDDLEQALRVLKDAA
jgi:cystathionine beta-lyase